MKFTSGLTKNTSGLPNFTFGVKNVISGQMLRNFRFSIIKRLQGIVHPSAYTVDLKPWLDPADQGGKCLTNPDACKDDPQLGFHFQKYFTNSVRDVQLGPDSGQLVVRVSWKISSQKDLRWKIFSRKDSFPFRNNQLKLERSKRNWK